MTLMSHKLAVEHSVPLPLYAKVKAMVADRINSGEWRPNDRVPSESELVQLLGFSRMTINRALRELTAEGLLVRLQGVGTFVAEPKRQSALFEIQNIADEIQARNHQHRSAVMQLQTVSATREQAMALNMQPGSEIFHSSIIHYENDVPIQIEDRFVNPDVAPEYLQQDFTQLTPNIYLNRLAPLTEGEHVVEAVSATALQSKWLQLAPHEPCLLICRRTWSQQVNVSYARLLYPGTRHRLKGHFTS
ncbi:histidine utilization repressor [Citrobacter sp. HN-141]|nr:MULTISPECIES: histidine utilization repressor [unclassified Citrobacter]MDW2645611.1 histidine utilization repressor [Citrobacter sp. HN-141]MDW2655161.1 histidine utilization repressor [Citrobacter sp. HN-120]MDW2698186.1 histidine utilization repressor [Citrobacter sp. HN-144]